MAHTPGPWKVKTETEHDDIGLSITFVTDIYPVVESIELVGSQEEQFANARLIAAAPDLLEACKRAKAYLAGIGLDYDEDGAGSPEFESLCTAIAKAEGE